MELYHGLLLANTTVVLQVASLSEGERAGSMMIRSQQQRIHIANQRKTIHDDAPETLEIYHGIEVVPIAPGLEHVPTEDHRYTQAPQLALGEEEKEILAENHHRRSERRPSICWMPRKWFWILVAAIVLATAIAVAVGVAVRPKHAHNNPPSPSPTTPPPTSSATSAVSTPDSIVKPTFPPSTSGAFKGTGMALLDLGVGSKDLFIYFQDYAGQIRSSELKGNAWLTGPSSDVVVGLNVKNGTPISAVSYTQNMTTMVHLFYIDSFNIVQEAIKSNISDGWINGSLGASNWQASGSSSVDLAACNNNEHYNATGNGGGVRLFYGVDDKTVRELIYSFATREWTAGYSFAGANGDGGLSCAGVNSGITYLYLLNQQNQLEYWWYDFASPIPSVPSHPPNTWVKGSAANTPMRAKSAISNSNYIYFQDPSDDIVGIQFAAASENSTWLSSFPVGRAVKALPGTRIASTTFFPTSDTPSELHIFFQTNSSDIMEYLRGQNGGQWSSNIVPVGQ